MKLEESAVIEWFPIETAPKDGTLVLLYTPMMRVTINGGYWDNHPKCKYWIAGGYIQYPEPEWWAPLPMPPKMARDKIEPSSDD